MAAPPRFRQVESLIAHVNACRSLRFQLILGIPETARDCDCGRQNGKSSRRERTNRQVKETMAPAYGTKLYERAWGLSALDKGEFGK